MLKRRMNMNQDQFLLKWNNHQNNFVEVFSFLRAQDAFVDVTLACDGKSFPAHKVVLSACSPYFQALFQNNPCKHPIVFLKDVKGQELEALIEFIYKGEVSVCQSELASLISTAENLKIKGLAEPDRPIDKGYKRISSPPRIQQSVSLPQAMPPCSLPPQGISPPQQTITHHKVVKYTQSSPGAKRKRLDTTGVYTSAIGNIYSSSSRDNEPDIDDNIESIALRSDQQHSVVASAPPGPGPGPPTAQVVLVSAHELPPHQAGEIIPVQSYASHHSAGNSESGGGAVLYTVSSVSGAGGIYAATGGGQQVSSSSTRVESTLMQPRGGEQQPHYSQPDQVYLSEDESHHESTISGSSVVKSAPSHSDHHSHAMAIKMEPSISHQMDQWEESDQGYEDKVPHGSVGSLPPEVSAETLENAARDHHSLQMPGMHSDMSDASQLHDSSRSVGKVRPSNNGSRGEGEQGPENVGGSRVVWKRYGLGSTATAGTSRSSSRTSNVTPSNLAGSSLSVATDAEATTVTRASRSSSRSSNVTPSNLDSSSYSHINDADDATDGGRDGTLGKRGSKWKFSCMYCNKTFPTRWGLDRHTRTHTGEKPYTCHICQRTFNEQSNYQRHFRRHFLDK